MQPPAEVEPARISQGEQAASSIAIDRMSAARAVSRLEKLILRMASITGRASKAVMSTCSTTFDSSSGLVVGGVFHRVCFYQKPPPQPYPPGGTVRRRARRGEAPRLKEEGRPRSPKE